MAEVGAWGEGFSEGMGWQEEIKDVAPDRQIKVKIIAVNGSQEAVSGPEAEIILPP